MMQLFQCVAVFASICLLRFTVGKRKTEFTIEPPHTVYGSLGSDVIIHWTFTFGNQQNWLDFEEIYWGQTDNNDRVRDKFLTVYKDGTSSINNGLQPDSLRSRLGVDGNVSRDGCSVDFILKNVTWQDQDKTYGCIAIVAGENFRSGPISLGIRVPPTIINRSNRVIDVEEGAGVKLLCEATGVPTPFIEWSNSTVLLQRRNSSTELLIQKIERKDGGSYVCKAINDAGSVSYSVDVRVVPYRPYINDTASSNAVVKSWVNHTTSLKCAVDANPAANFTWFKDSQPILNGVNSAHDITTFTLTPRFARDFGQYSCKATNIKGTAWCNIAVEQLFLPSPPIIKKLLPEMLSIKVTWNASLDHGGSPILDYRIILLDMNNNVKSRTTGIKDNKFTLQNLRQNRTYRVLIQARNVVGYGKSANATVSTLEADPPRILSITTIPSLMSVNISWNSTNDNTGIKILDYRVILVDTFTQQLQKFIGINISKLYVENLKHNRTYVIKVQARNEDGYGWFESRNFTTLEADRPRVLSITAVPSITSVNISWNSTNDNTGIEILDYRITVIDTITTQWWEFTGINVSNLHVTKLKHNRTYLLKAQARNEDGYGRFKNINFTTSEAVPPGPPIIKAIPHVFALAITWEPSRQDINNIKVLDYRIKVLNGTFAVREYSAVRNTSIVITNLAGNRTYVVEIRARNEVGYGQSANIRATTLLPDLSSTIGTEYLSTSHSITEDGSSSKETPTSQKTEYHTVSHDRTGEPGVKEDKKPAKNILVYFAPLWIVVTAFASPAIVFMLWKANKKIMRVRCCTRRPPPTRSREFHNRDSESSASTMEDMNEKTDVSHYETITEVFEMHFNHGYTTEEEKGLENGQSVKPPNVYNHLHETSLDSDSGVQQTSIEKKKVGQVKPPNLGQKAELKSGLGMFPNNEYSHLIHADSFVKRQSPIPSDYSTIASNCLWEICRDRLKLQKTIGCGEFGLVMKGLALNVTKNGGWVQVAVKTLNFNGEANELCRKALKSELEVMKDLSAHKHVIQLLACITESEPICVITEFAPYGDLLGFLRKKRGLKDDYYNVDQLPKKRLTSYQLMQFAWEIADGMDYLSSAKIIHRDLAARNVLLGENLTCKVTDFGMARDVRGQDMYQKMTGGRLPVKWTAIEALLHGVYTTKSDVWSFGVVLFEIVTMGGNPYPDMEVLELIDRLESGYRLDKPRHVADEVYNLMLSCWNEDPDKRPTFRQLYSALNHLAKGKQACINLRTYDGRLYENFQMPPR